MKFAIAESPISGVLKLAEPSDFNLSIEVLFVPRHIHAQVSDHV